MQIHVDRNHRKELQSAFISDKEGNLLLPGNQIMGKDEDFNRNFKDEFGQQGPWVVGENNVYAMAIKNGVYSIEHKDNDGTHFSWVPLAVDDANNWGIEASITTQSLPGDNSFGLTFGLNLQTGDKNLFFINTNNSTFSIYTFQNNIWQEKFSNKNCSGIHPEINVLRVEQVDRYWHYYINGNLIYCEPAGTLFEPKFGFGINGSAIIDIEYFKIQW